MVNEKARIIKKLGISTTVKYPDGTTADVKCLVGRASTIFNSMLSLEAHRKGDFLIEDNVVGGCLITNTLSGETYLSVATYPATFQNMLLSRLSHMLVCNAKVSVQRYARQADDNGNVTTIPVDIVSGLDVYIQVVDQQMRQYDPGIHIDSEYVIYCPSVDLQSLDKVTLVGYDGKSITLKAVTVDNLTYPGISYIQVMTETRK